MAEASADGDGDWNFLHEELIPTLLVGGVLLVLFPDPVTSSLGLVLVGIGLVLWVWDVVG